MKDGEISKGDESPSQHGNGHKNPFLPALLEFGLSAEEPESRENQEARYDKTLELLYCLLEHKGLAAVC